MDTNPGTSKPSVESDYRWVLKNITSGNVCHLQANRKLIELFLQKHGYKAIDHYLELKTQLCLITL